MKPTLASRRARIARVQAKHPDNVRVDFAEREDPVLESALDRWVRSLLDSPATPDERRRP